MARHKLNELPYNWDVFKIEANTESHTSVPLTDVATAIEEDNVSVLSETHGTSGIICHTIAITYVSRDEYFHAEQ